MTHRARRRTRPARPLAARAGPRKRFRDRAARDRERAAPGSRRRTEARTEGEVGEGRARAPVETRQNPFPVTNQPENLLRSWNPLFYPLWLTARGARAFFSLKVGARRASAFRRARLTGGVETRSSGGGDARVRTSPRARASRPHAIDMVFSRTEHTPLLNEGARSPMEPARARRVRPRRSQVSPEGPLARTRRSCIDNTRDARGPASGGACSEATRAGAAARARPRRARRVARSPRGSLPRTPVGVASSREARRRRGSISPERLPQPAGHRISDFFPPPPSFLAPFILVSQKPRLLPRPPASARGASFATSLAPPSSASRSSPSSGPAPRPASMSRDSLLAIPPRADRSRRRTRLAAPPPPRPP